MALKTMWRYNTDRAGMTIAAKHGGKGEGAKGRYGGLTLPLTLFHFPFSVERVEFRREDEVAFAEAVNRVRPDFYFSVAPSE